MGEISGIAVLSAFLAGVVSFLSPCVLPLVPGYLSYVAGQTYDEMQLGTKRLSALSLSLFFVLGFSTVFIALGASATVLGQLLLTYRYEANIVGGVLIIAFGLFMTGVLKLPWLQQDFRFNLPLRGGHPASAYVLGLAFAFGWTPCIGPILGAILTVSASESQSGNGIVLLAIYSLGLSLPFLLATLLMDTFIHRLKTMRQLGRIFYPAAGVILIVMGLAMITGYFSKFAFWLLNTFPVLGTIG